MSINTGWRTTENLHNVEAVVDQYGEQIATFSERHTEAFGAIRIAQFTPTAGWTFAYNINPALVRTTTDGETGSVVRGATNLAHVSTGTDAAGFAQIQTVKTNRYIPGVGGLVRFTALFDDPKPDSVQEFGIIDNKNGWAFGYNGEEFGILRRSAGVDNWIPQSEWNIDKRPDLDPTKGNVYQIAYQWLGFGPQLFYVENTSGQIRLVHRIDYVNLNNETSIANPNLPVTARVENKGNTSDVVLRTASAMAGLDGDPEETPISVQLATDVEQLDVTSGTGIPVLTIRNPTTWLGQTNYLPIQAMRFSFAAEANKPVRFQLFANATVSGGTYSDIASGVAPVQVNKTFTSATGGLQIGSLPIGKTGQGVIDLSNRKSLGFPGQELTILANSSGSGDIDAGVSMLQFL